MANVNNAYTDSEFVRAGATERLKNSFTKNGSSYVAMRVVGSSGSSSVDVSTNSVDVGGYIGKPTGQNGDFVTAYASATTITISNFPSDVGAFYADDVVSVEQYASDGSLTKRWTRDDSAMSVTSNVLTVDDAAFVATDTFVIYTNVPRPESVDSGNARYISPVDFTATYTSSTTITLSSVPFTIQDSSQIVYIKVVPSSGDAAVYVNGSNSVTITVSSNVLSISGAGTPFASGDVYEVGINEQDKAYDPSTSSLMNSTLNPVYNRYTDAETLVTAQDLTASYADFGAEIDMTGYTHLRVGIVADVNDSENVTLKLLGLDESGGSDEYEIEGGTTQALWTTGASDSKFSYTFDVKATPVIQLQAIAGTLGATAGDLTITISKIWKGGN